jgi:hypothetical protein
MEVRLVKWLFFFQAVCRPVFQIPFTLGLINMHDTTDIAQTREIIWAGQ